MPVGLHRHHEGPTSKAPRPARPQGDPGSNPALPCSLRAASHHLSSLRDPYRPADAGRDYTFQRCPMRGNVSSNPSPSAPTSRWRMPVGLHSKRGQLAGLCSRAGLNVSPDPRRQHLEHVGECRRDYRVRASTPGWKVGGSSPPPACRSSSGKMSRHASSPAP